MFRGGLMQADKPISGHWPQLVISKALIVRELTDSRCCVFAATTAQQSTENQIVSHHQENRFFTGLRLGKSVWITMKGSWGLTGFSGDGDDFWGSDGILGRWWGGDLAGGR